MYRKVVDFNQVTIHFLEVIHSRLELTLQKTMVSKDASTSVIEIRDTITSNESLVLSTIKHIEKRLVVRGHYENQFFCFFSAILLIYLRTFRCCRTGSEGASVDEIKQKLSSFGSGLM
jgi:hypothetical protein